MCENPLVIFSILTLHQPPRDAERDIQASRASGLHQKELEAIRFIRTVYHERL